MSDSVNKSSNEQTKKNVPAIRFKGFEGEWERQNIDKITSPVSNNSLSRAKLNYHSGVAKNIHYGDILIKFDAVLDANRGDVPFITYEADANKLIGSALEVGDLIFSDAAEDRTVGKSIELIKDSEYPVFAGLHTITFRPTHTFAKGYLGYYTNSEAYREQLYPLMQGTKVLSLSRRSINQTYISHPVSTVEQRQIASFLSKLDNNLNQHQSKLEQLKKLKQSMLQKMLPQGNATEPEIRFKGFTGEWRALDLADICNIIGGGTPSTAIPEYWHNGTIDWYSPTEIGTAVYADSSVKKITTKGYENSSAKMLPPNRTILFTSRAGIGDMAILRREGCTNQGFQSLVLNDDIDPYFIYSMGYLIKDYALKHASGSTFLEISSKQLSKMPLLLPSEKEQQKIGSYFRELDELIKLEQIQLGKLKQIKQAFLAYMLI